MALGRRVVRRIAALPLGWGLRPRGICFALVATACAVLPRHVVASTVYVTGTGASIRYDAAAGEVNGLTVSKVGTYYHFSDGLFLTAGNGCEMVTTVTARCPVAGITQIQVFGGDMDDYLGGLVAGSNVQVFLDGGIGNDTLEGGPLGDTLIGGNGMDILIGGGGYDQIKGDGGIDTVDYSDDLGALAKGYVVVEVGGTGGDDFVSEETEIIIGTPGNDVIVGDNLDGSDPFDDDVIYGLGGDDYIEGGSGADQLFGGDDNDELVADGDDTTDIAVDGGDGVDNCHTDGPPISDPVVNCETSGSTTSTSTSVTSSTTSTTTTSTTTTSTSSSSTSTSSTSTSSTTTSTIDAICGNGMIETGTGSPDTDENCEFADSGGADLGSALDAAGGYLDTNFDSMSGTALDFTTQEFAIEFFLRVDETDGTLPYAAGTQRILSKGGITTDAAGWSLSLLSTGALRFEGDNANCNSPTTCNNDASDSTADQDCNSTAAIQPNTLYHIALTRNDNNCNFWLLNVSDCLANDNCDTATHASIDASDDDLFETMVVNNTDPNIMASSSGPGSNPTNGVMDELRVWSWADGGTDDTAAWEAANMDDDWLSEVTSGSGLVARWDFDQTISTVTEQIGSFVAAANGSVSLITSPFSTGSGGGGEEFGCTPPQTCDPTTCRCENPSQGQTFYLDDANCDDDNSGTTVGTGSGTGGPNGPWCTIARATDSSETNHLSPGDTLIVRNGMYTENVNIVGGDVVPALNGGACNGMGANALCGTSTAPITISAENERQAVFTSNGTDPSWFISGAQYYVIDGITAQQTDNASDANPSNHVFTVNISSNVTFRRTLANRSQRCGNNHLYKLTDVQDFLCDGCEGWRHARHGFSQTGGLRVTCRDCYFNSAGYEQCPEGAGCPANCSTGGGPENGGYIMYPANNARMENVFGEGEWGFTIAGAPGSFQGLRAADNQVWTSAFAPQSGTGIGGKIHARGNENPIRGPLRASVTDVLVVNPAGIGIRNSVAVDTRLDRVTVWKDTQASAGLLVNDPAFNANDQAKCEDLSVAGESSSITITNSIFRRSAGDGVSIENCDAAGETQVCTIGNTAGGDGNWANDFACESECSTACGASGAFTRAFPSGIGDSGTNCYHGGTFGADIRCRTENGVKQSGADDSLFCENSTIPGCSSMITSNSACTAVRSAGPVTPCRNGLNICGAVVTGINDAGGCVSFAQRVLRQSADDSQCGGGTINLACP